MRFLGVVATLVVALAAVAFASHVNPEHYGDEAGEENNPSCAFLNPSWNEVKVDQAPNGDYPDSGGTDNPGGDGPLVFTVENSNGEVFDWKSNMGVDAVVVKGGNRGSNVYFYDPEDTADTGLRSPNNTKGNRPAVSHISACYDVESREEEPGQQEEEPDQPEQQEEEPDQPEQQGDEPDQPEQQEEEPDQPEQQGDEPDQPEQQGDEPEQQGDEPEQPEDQGEEPGEERPGNERPAEPDEPQEQGDEEPEDEGNAERPGDEPQEEGDTEEDAEDEAGPEADDDGEGEGDVEGVSETEEGEADDDIEEESAPGSGDDDTPDDDSLPFTGAPVSPLILVALLLLLAGTAGRAGTRD